MKKLVFVTATFVTLMSGAAFAETGMIADVTLNPMGNFKAKTNDVKGEAHVKGDEVTADNIVVNLKTIKTGMDLRDNHAKNKYLEVEKYPEAVLMHGQGKGGKGTGTLKLHGKEAPVAGTYEIKGKEVVAKFPIHLKDYGIEGINYKGVGVEDEVKVEITIPIGAAAAAPAAAKAVSPAAPKAGAPVKK